jgi:hypothetical protein
MKIYTFLTPFPKRKNWGFDSYFQDNSRHFLILIFIFINLPEGKREFLFLNNKKLNQCQVIFFLNQILTFIYLIKI